MPEGYAELPDWTGMSNFMYTIDDGFEDRLRTGRVWGHHAGREFNGRVWFEDGLFHEQVWRYGEVRAHVAEPTLQRLMTAVNDVWGWG